MIPQYATLAILGLVAFTLRSRPVPVLVLCQFLLLLVPISVQEYYVPGVHPGALLIVIYAPLYFSANAPDIKPSVSGLVPLIQLAVIGLALTSTSVPQDLTSSLKIVVSVLVAPLAYTLVAYSAINRGSTAARLLQLSFFTCLVVNVTVAAGQEILSRPIFFEQINVEYYRWGVFTSGRRAGLMGTPLDLGLLCAVATPLVATVKSPRVRYVLLTTCVIGAAVAQARTSLVVVGATALFVVLSDTRRLIWNVLAGVVLVAGGAQYANSTRALEGVKERFAGDQGDAYRFQAYGWFADNYHHYLVFGEGPFADPRTIGATTSSLESTYLVYAYNFGLLFALALLVVQVAYVRRLASGSRHRRALALSGSVFILMVASYSGLAATPQLASLIGLISVFAVGTKTDNGDRGESLLDTGLSPSRRASAT